MNAGVVYQECIDLHDFCGTMTKITRLNFLLNAKLCFQGILQAFMDPRLLMARWFPDINN